MVTLIVYSIGLAAISFVFGVIYGRATEAKAIGFALRVESYVKQEYVDIIAKVRATEAVELARLRRYL